MQERWARTFRGELIKVEGGRADNCLILPFLAHQDLGAQLRTRT